MAAKELKNMSRTELLELLIERTAELEQVKAQLEEALAQQECVQSVPVYEHAGTMAEAAMQLGGVFEAADRAARQYLDSAEQMMRNQEAVCAQMENEAREKAEKLLVEAELKCRKMEHDTQVHCAMLLRNAEQEVGRNWNELFARLDKLSEENSALRFAMDQGDKKRKWSL